MMATGQKMDPYHHHEEMAVDRARRSEMIAKMNTRIQAIKNN